MFRTLFPFFFFPFPLFLIRRGKGDEIDHYSDTERTVWINFIPPAPKRCNLFTTETKWTFRTKQAPLMSYLLKREMDSAPIVSTFELDLDLELEKLTFCVFRKRLDLENAWGVLRYGVLVCQDCKLVHIALESQRKQNVSYSQLHSPNPFSVTLFYTQGYIRVKHLATILSLHQSPPSLNIQYIYSIDRK